MTISAIISAIPPGLVLIAGGFLLPFMPARARPALILALPLVVLWMVWQMPDGVALSLPFLDHELEPVKVDRLSRLFGLVFAFMTFAGGLFALTQARPGEMAAAFVHAGSAIGITFAGDMITLFVFWEVMALASTVVIWSAGTRHAYRAGMRYIAVHLLGGALLMAGILSYIGATGSPALAGEPIHAALGHGPGTWLILAGFLINAGAPPLSAWLPDAYPEASPGGMVFLSAYTTKSAVYVLLRAYPGFEPLVFIGLYMVFYGIIYALLENDMRRILAYSIVNQVGFMVTGVGLGTEMALNGAAAHASTHIIYKALLVMSAGSVLYMTGKRKCTDLGGLFQSMPLTTICGIVGAVSISSFPLTSGFISKPMISQGAANLDLAWLWFLLAAASAGVFLHAGIKFPWFVFFQKDSGLRPPDPPLNMKLAMLLFAFLCIAIGVWPGPLYDLMPYYPVDFVPYTSSHVLDTLQLLMFSGLAFFVMLPQMTRTLTISLDIDWFYRKLGKAVVTEFTNRGGQAQGSFERRLRGWVEHGVATIFRYHGPEGVLARTWPTGSTVLWVAILLAAYLLVYYL